MIRPIAGVLPAGFLTLLIALPTQAAPGPKEIDKPLPPISPVQRIKSSNNLKQIGLAMHNYVDTINELPTNLLTKDGKPGLSWRVAILPFIDEDKLYKEFGLDEPWDSERNLKLVERLPKAYTPVRGRAEKGETFYQMFAGERTMLASPGKAINFAGVTDGLSNTIMVTEADKAVIWTKPVDMAFDGKSLPKLGGMFDGEFHVLMGDGSVKRVPKGVDADVMKRAIIRDDGEAVDLDAAIKKAKE